MTRYEIEPQRDVLGRPDETWFVKTDEERAEIWAVFRVDHRPDPVWIADFATRDMAERLVESLTE